MDPNKLITKVTQILERSDGSEIKIVVKAMFGEGLQRSIGVYALRRESPESEWVLLNDRPAQGWKNMSREEYLKNGRSEMLQAVSHAEILKLTGMIGKPIDSVEEVEQNSNLFDLKPEDDQTPAGMRP